MWIGQYISRICKTNKPKTIKIVDIKDQEHNIEMDRTTTIQEIKNHIQQKLCKSLSKDQMALIIGEEELANNREIGELNDTVVIRQRKIDLNKIPNLPSIYEEDPYMGEMAYMAKMPCGHSISRDSMVELIRSQIDKNLCEIRCPFNDDSNNKCLRQWEFKLCKRVGVLTKEETEEFEDGLNFNWMKKFGKKCPSCKQGISKGDLKTNKVKCPSCKSHEFCYICLQPWENKGSSDFCGSQSCQFYNSYLANAPMDRIFQYTQPNNKGQNQTIKIATPRYRMCPHCKYCIQHIQKCKHILCPNCKRNFCWICLDVLDGKWKCGSYNQYCGRVAQIQRLI